MFESSIVGVVKTEAPFACLSRPATNCRPMGDKISFSFFGIKAFIFIFLLINDWWRCQPDENKFGRLGRHINVA